MQAHDIASGRDRRHNIEEEDATIGKLGEEFDDAGCLLISEVELVFSQPDALGSAGGEAGAGSRDEVATAVFSKTKDYVSEFMDQDGNPIDQPAETEGLQLTQFEMAQLANLCITELDEAKALIPTLATRDDALLDSLLQEMDNIRRFS
ncbi:related to Rpb4 - 16 kD subunit of DNA-directed RNA polymerase II [Melanopsichium pennsylvanicum]|uniref:Related to Rpb4 - 16 kD subunit of DNA-directed RNA polymerase II n=1 Tax=Melanopsichium pennsylvanicum TaxID=63383 RepID=A0AAJ5C8N7_9BASI|nr:related to Rpb4 - 16 kD subunit of DNA-directed RNA polymerase II [Melanopsichium pennsylvanicum]